MGAGPCPGSLSTLLGRGFPVAPGWGPGLREGGALVLGGSCSRCRPRDGAEARGPGQRGSQVFGRSTLPPWGPTPGPSDMPKPPPGRFGCARFPRRQPEFTCPAAAAAAAVVGPAALPPATAPPPGIGCRPSNQKARSVGARFRRAHRKPARRAAPAQCAPRAWFQRSFGPGPSWGRRGPSALGAQRRRAGARPAGCLKSGSPRWVSGARGGAGGARRLGQCRGRGGRARSPEQPCPAVPGRRASCGGAGSPSSPRPRPPRFARADASGPWRLCPSPLILLPPPASVSARSPAASVCPSGDPPSVQPLFYLTSATLKKK